jgi:hypothetical protein
VNEMRRCHASSAIIIIEFDHQGAKNCQAMDRVNYEIGLLSEQEPDCIADSVVLNDHDRSAVGKYIYLRS